MSEKPRELPGDLQFDRIEPGDGAPVEPAVCGHCGQPLASTYYQVRGQAACERCKAQIQYDQMSASGSGRFLRASALGFVAALVGAALWYGVRVGTGYEIGLIAIVVGLLVGGAVRYGSRGVGGVLYQVLAVSLTYFGICVQYVPDIVKALTQQAAQQAPAASAASADASAQPAGAIPAADAPTAPPSGAQMAGALALLLGLAMAAPFLGGFQNIIGILIIAFALWEAWKMNRHAPLVIEGPFRLGAPPPAGPR